MRDGRTRKLAGTVKASDFHEFTARYAASLVVIAGQDIGVELPLDRERLVVGRGPGVDHAFADPAMSRQHAAIEYARQGFRVQDLGSTNGILVNGARVKASDLRRGDRFQVGASTLQLVIEEREPAAEVFELLST